MWLYSYCYTSVETVVTFIVDWWQAISGKNIYHSTLLIPVLVILSLIAIAKSVCANWTRYLMFSNKPTTRLTHWGRVTHICVNKLTIIGSDNDLSLGLRKTFRWNFKRNSYIFIQENSFENVVWEVATILSRPQCVNRMWLKRTRKPKI